MGDFDGDGTVALHETRSLAELGIASITLAARDVDDTAAGGNRIAQRGTFTRTDGTTGTAADVFLHYVRA